jgi:tetratricopeptide (TPR) repeat protein
MARDDSCRSVDDTDILEVSNLDVECKVECKVECIETTMPRIRLMGVQGTLPEGEEDALDTQMLLDLGVAHREMGQLGSAMRYFRRALADEERRVYGHLMVALCLLDQDRIREAVTELKKGLYLDQVTELEALALQYELAVAYERLGEVKEALFYYRRVRRLSPGFRNTTARLARLTFRLRAAPRSRPVRPTPAPERRWPSHSTSSLIRLKLAPTG